MNIQQKAIDAYAKHKHLKLAANEIGIPWQTVYVHLKKAGVPVTGDKSRYGCETDRLAVKAERLFESLIPTAKNQNENRFQAKVDFVVNGLSIDVKASRRRKANGKYKSERWAFCLKKQEAVADFFVCFALSDNDEPNGVLLIPGEIARKYSTISLPANRKGKWWDYEVDVSELKPFFDAFSANKDSWKS